MIKIVDAVTGRVHLIKVRHVSSVSYMEKKFAGLELYNVEINFASGYSINTKISRDKENLELLERMMKS